MLIRGESGVGKELLAKTLYLLGNRTESPYVSVNCPRFQDTNTTISELFGHKRGSFTGATTNRKGSFEIADGGVVFLDEVGDLHLGAQTMLLRTLAEGEFQPLGSSRSCKTDVRIVAATNRPLNQLAADEGFRRDLLFRLHFFRLDVPPLREREDDWRLLTDHVLRQLKQRYGDSKRFSPDALELLAGYRWPGNVRELIGLTTAAFAMARSSTIEPRDFQDRLQPEWRPEAAVVEELYRRLEQGEGNFWDLVQKPFMERDLNRNEVCELVALGLRDTLGSYRNLVTRWSLNLSEYQKFMDFLRHHRLKPGKRSL